MRMFLYILLSSALGGNVVLHPVPDDWDASAARDHPQRRDCRRHRRPGGLVGRPIAFEETRGHHPQKATRMLAVYAFVIDNDFDMCRAWYSAAHSEEGLLVSQVAGDPEGHISAPDKARTTTRLIEPASVVESLMQINETLPLLAIHFRSGRQQAKTAKPEILDFTPRLCRYLRTRVAEPVNSEPISDSWAAWRRGVRTGGPCPEGTGFARGRGIAELEGGGSKSVVLLTGDREFQSRFLRRRVMSLDTDRRKTGPLLLPPIASSGVSVIARIP
jgi:hypothetical protein